MFRALTLSILMMLVSYVMFEEAGIASVFNERINGEAEVAVTMDRPIRVQVISSYSVSVLKDPKVKEFKIYRGTMKKSAVDRMEYIGQMKIDFSAGATTLMVEAVIETVAKKYGANVAIIDNYTTKSAILGSTDERGDHGAR